jgi:hypothetical protein
MKSVLSENKTKGDLHMAKIITIKPGDSVPDDRDLLRLDRLADGSYRISGTVQTDIDEVTIISSDEHGEREAMLSEARLLAEEYSIPEIYVEDAFENGPVSRLNRRRLRRAH